MIIERQSLNQILEDNPELQVNGNWLCLNIDTPTSWPTRPQSFIFEERLLWLMPRMTDAYPGIAINRPADLNEDDTWALLHRALSLIVWTDNAGATVMHMIGGNLPRMMGLTDSNGGSLRGSFDFSDLPTIQDERGRLALALMREGRGLNHPAYAFLSFFRALETAIPNGLARGQWVTANIDNISGHRATDALSKLKVSVQGDIGVHLRESGRHAIAHAQAHPIINPDDPRDARRLQREKPIIEALATLAIESHLGIQTRHTVWKQHLYELRGWKVIFGDKMIADILSGIEEVEEQKVDIPKLNVRLRESEPFPPFEGMHPLFAGSAQGKIELVFQSSDGLIDLIFWLNFGDERLEFNAQQSITVRDDGSVAAARNAQDIERFLRDYYGNGELQCWNAESGALLSRCDAFMPLNCYLDLDAANANIAKWDAVIAEREKL